MSLLPVEEALARVLAGIARPVAAETVAIAAAHGRTLAVDVAARRTQPPFAASAMDGYAVRAADVAAVPARLTVIGRSVAGAGFAGAVGPMQAVRIFTGAPVPAGADAVAIQEDADGDGDDVIVRAPVAPGKHIRAAGLDFRHGDMLIAAGQRLDARLVALAAAAGPRRPPGAPAPARRDPRHRRRARAAGRPRRPGPDRRLEPLRGRGDRGARRRRADRPRHRQGHARGARPGDREGARGRRRHARDARRRLRRRGRSRAIGARPPRHDARVLARGAAPRQAADPWPARRRC